MRLIPFLLLLGLAYPADSRSDVHSRCVSCVNACPLDCSRAEDRRSCKASCRRACHRQKAQDCRQNGHGPGPRTTCSCT